MERFDDDPDFETREERRAAEEAGRIGGAQPDIGGPDSDAPADDALHPVYEAGGGEAEGFELSERDLVRNASHDDGEGDPARDRFAPEAESDRATSEAGEADEERHRDA